MSSMKQARLELANELSTPCSPFIPSKVTPPIIIMGAQDDMLEVAGFGKWTYRLELYLIAGTATNDQALSGIEDMVEKTIGEISWHISEISAPYMSQSGGNQYLTVRIAVSKTITIGGN